MHVYIAALIRAYNKFKKKIAKSLLLPGWTSAVFGKNYSDFFEKRALTTFLLAIVFFELFYCKKRIIVEISVPCMYNWCIHAVKLPKQNVFLRFACRVCIPVVNELKFQYFQYLLLWTSICCHITKILLTIYFTLLKTLCQIESYLEVNAANTTTW